MIRTIRPAGRFLPPLSLFAVEVFQARSSAVQVDGDQMAAGPTFQSLKALSYGDRPPVWGAFDDAEPVRCRFRRGAGGCPEQFRSSGWRLSLFAGDLGR